MRVNHDPLRSIPVRSEETTGDLLMAVGRALRRRVAAALESYDVTPGQSRALHVVVEHGASRPSEIADALRIAPRSATEVVDALEARGLVTREPDPTDRRAKLVEATGKGKKLARKAEEILATPPAALSALGEDELETLRALRKLLAAT